MRAAEMLGGEGMLARHLRYPEYLVALWLRGHASVPDRAFYVAVDVIMDEKVKPLEERRSTPRLAEYGPTTEYAATTEQELSQTG